MTKSAFIVVLTCLLLQYSYLEQICIDPTLELDDEKCYTEFPNFCCKTLDFAFLNEHQNFTIQVVPSATITNQDTIEYHKSRSDIRLFGENANVNISSNDDNEHALFSISNVISFVSSRQNTNLQFYSFPFKVFTSYHQFCKCFCWRF